jgi:23S rRNA pseudouridine2457 synthase
LSFVVLFNKPFQVLCQFTDRSGRKTLADFISLPGIYAAGRLDYDSEGLVVLTGDGGLQKQITDPGSKIAKTYLVQVEGIPGVSHLQELCQGVPLKDGKTRPAKVEMISPPEELWERTPPIRSRQRVPTSWLRIAISEGRNRQVRRMTAAVGFPALRLIRTAIGPWTLGRLRPGQWEKIRVGSLRSGGGPV